MSKLINILLQRNDPTIPWGLQLSGSRCYGESMAIERVLQGTLAGQHLNVNDVVLEIAGFDTRILALLEAESLIRAPFKSLQLLVLKPDTSQERIIPVSYEWEKLPDVVHSGSATNNISYTPVEPDIDQLARGASMYENSTRENIPSRNSVGSVEPENILQSHDMPKYGRGVSLYDNSSRPDIPSRNSVASLEQETDSFPQNVQMLQVDNKNDSRRGVSLYDNFPRANLLTRSMSEVKPGYRDFNAKPKAFTLGRLQSSPTHLELNDLVWKSKAPSPFVNNSSPSVTAAEEAPLIIFSPINTPNYVEESVTQAATLSDIKMITTGICPCGRENCLAIFFWGSPDPRYLRSLQEAIFPTPKPQIRRRKKPTRRSRRLMNKSGIVIGRTRKGRTVRKPERLGINYLAY